MARLVVKSSFLSPAASGGMTHLLNYVRYIGTREGVELNAPIDAPCAPEPHAPGRKPSSDLPPTEKQQRMIRQLLEDFPDSRSSLEYEDYKAAPSMETASEFIGRTTEDNFGAEHWREDYVYYLATRPGAERSGSHGLWGADDEPIDLDEAAYRVANHSGNVWTHIISLRREDAQKVGMETASRWREPIRAQTNTIAQAMGIPSEDLRWYAAFHNESHHPHIHMVAYSVGAEPYLGKQGLQQIKSGLAGEIFREELLETYRQQTHDRDELSKQWRELLSGGDELTQVEAMLHELAQYMAGYQGRAVYGYLSRAQRELVDRIVDKLGQTQLIRELYAKWYEKRDAITGIYKGTPEPRQLLSQNKTFKPLKNAVIRAAVDMAAASAPSDRLPTGTGTLPMSEDVAQEEAVPMTGEEWLERYPYPGERKASEEASERVSPRGQEPTVEKKNPSPRKQKRRPASKPEVSAALSLLRVFERALRSSRPQQQKGDPSPTRRKEIEKKQAQGMKVR